MPRKKMLSLPLYRAKLAPTTGRASCFGPQPEGNYSFEGLVQINSKSLAQ